MKKEIQLIELKDKMREIEKEQDEQETYFITVIGSSIVCTGLATFIWYKKILDEYWYYGTGLFAGLALIAFILGIYAYKREKEASRKLKELKKQEKELKNSIK